ncbi:transmembrane protein, putative (macronuclear) [Tetrahymena thermophila SB210]|uniref:Transmembrane protein, putative n=1 Tax=Tetrahymena thermophila (strain SB210) TaxID=312017 RepID=W7XB76_TETTS|nr:transmembrane protein, putative [Tetrahymena thermophila SB210]EWS74587.1 transmembrane protein, putative [Tetrahymena thermophila SB210]|eukprot:XP_012652888.1 transmembrane protein, putative [Tetrahymena thermophila SB210]
MHSDLLLIHFCIQSEFTFNNSNVKSSFFLSIYLFIYHSIYLYCQYNKALNKNIRNLYLFIVLLFILFACNIALFYYFNAILLHFVYLSFLFVCFPAFSFLYSKQINEFSFLYRINIEFIIIKLTALQKISYIAFIFYQN